MASVAAAPRTILRSTSAHLPFLPKPKSKPSSSSPFRVFPNKPPSQSFLRRPVQMSFAVESNLPFHSATSSALMTSMLSFACNGYGLLSHACCEDS